MPEDHSLADLARMADVTPRTVRYYVAQGLLPSPDAAGPATRYTPGHLARLRLIRRLQRGHLPLAEIRDRLEQMTDAEVEAALAATFVPAQPAAPGPGPAGAAEYVRMLMDESGVEPRMFAAPGSLGPASARAAIEPDPANPNLLRAASPASVPPLQPAPGPSTLPLMERPAALRRAYADQRPPSTPATRSTWERLVITSDIEIHVRRPLRPLDNKRVDALERHARELFNEEP